MSTRHVRDYWGDNKGAERLLFGGSDDDLAFGSGKQDAYGNPVDSSVQSQRYDHDEPVPCARARDAIELSPRRGVAD